MKVMFVLDKYQLKPSKKLGQNFLIDENIVRCELQEAQIKKTDTVLEIGPGLGILTKALAHSAKKVLAIEQDSRMIAILTQELKDFDNVRIISGDALKIEFPEFDKCVANIPYSISSKITIKLGKAQKPAVIIYQKEFAERLAAAPGKRNYSRISVIAQYYFVPVYVRTVSRNCFRPAPKVDSAIVKLVPKAERVKPRIKNEEIFFKTVQGLFMHKNQKVCNSFSHSRHIFGLDKHRAKEIATEMPCKDRKVYMLNLMDLAEISNWLTENAISSENI